MGIEEYFKDWLKVIDRKELIKVMNTLSTEYKSKPICPDQADVFRAFKLCPLHDLKVIMLGQEPYPQKGVATGILFGNRKGTKEDCLSPSLKVVKEAVIDFDIPHNFITFDPTLESWAKQGILMLNSALTVEMNKVGSHTLLWRPFISKMLKNLSDINPGLIYVLLGSQAKSFAPYINKNNDVLLENHPAYYARINKDMPSDIFYKINKLLYNKYGYKIKFYDELNI